MIEDGKMQSVMRPYCKGLRLIKWMGLPLKINYTDNSTPITCPITFKDHLRWVKCVIVLGILLAIPCLSFSMVFLFTGKRWSEQKYWLAKYGIKKWELNTVYICLAICIFTLWLETCSFKGTSKALNEFATIMQQNPCLRPLNESAVYRKVWWRVVILNFLTLPILIFKFLYFFLYFMSDETTTDLSLYLAIADNIYSYLVNMLPSTSAAMELILYCFGLIGESLQQYMVFLDSAVLERYRNVDRVFEDGFDIIKLLSISNQNFGSMITVIYAFYLSSACIGFFLGTELLGVISGEVVDISQIFYPLAMFFTGVLSSVVVYEFARMGQDLSMMYKKVKKSLSKIKASEADLMTPKQSALMDELLEEFSTPCPIQPLDMFDMNFANVASLAGLAFTYIIVLLQFKIGDPQETPELSGT